MMTNCRVHTAGFGGDAVQLARTRGNLPGTARDLGINVAKMVELCRARVSKTGNDMLFSCVTQLWTACVVWPP